jgi:hypothetical protein
MEIAQSGSHFVARQRPVYAISVGGCGRAAPAHARSYFRMAGHIEDVDWTESDAEGRSGVQEEDQRQSPQELGNDSLCDPRHAWLQFANEPAETEVHPEAPFHDNPNCRAASGVRDRRAAVSPSPRFSATGRSCDAGCHLDPSVDLFLLAPRNGMKCHPHRMREYDEFVSGMREVYSALLGNSTTLGAEESSLNTTTRLSVEFIVFPKIWIHAFLLDFASRRVQVWLCKQSAR